MKTIVINISPDILVSRKAKDRLRTNAKKNIDNLDVLKSSDYLIEKYKLKFTNKTNNEETTTVVQDDDNVEEKNESVNISTEDKVTEIVITAEKENLPKTKEEERLELRQKLRKKINGKIDLRKNTFGKQSEKMSKEHGSELTNAYIEARRKMGVEIPDPDEIMSNKDKYIPQFREYAQYIKTMNSKDLNANPYHQYAKKVMKALNIDINSNNSVPNDETFKNFMDMIKKNKNIDDNSMGQIMDEVKDLSKNLNIDDLMNKDELNLDKVIEEGLKNKENTEKKELIIEEN